MYVKVPELVIYFWFTPVEIKTSSVSDHLK